MGGLSCNTSKKQLSDYFAQYGAIHDCIIIVDRDNKPRGFGFVTFSEYATVEKVLDVAIHRINDKIVECKQAFPKAVTDEELTP